ncbi:MAG TPA: diacylglycerol kinase family lipid kinase [Bacteroidales bacterium]|nr:diacylglycerol kinase family lipid kinase [Bacteroidales bacterium]
MPEPVAENQENEKQGVLVLINPASGSRFRRKKASVTRVEGVLDPARFQVQAIVPPSAAMAGYLIRQGLENNKRLIGIAGGDGSVNLAASLLAHKDASLVIIPNGSGNGLARHLHIPLDPAKALKLIEDGKQASIDTGLINGRRFVSLCGIGFDALVAKRFKSDRRRGFLSYLRIALIEYFRYQPKTYHLILDGREVITEALFIVFANADQFGYNTFIAPHASVTDGTLDVCIFRKVPLVKAPLVISQIFRGQIDRSHYAEVMKAKHIQVISRKGRYVNIDGEPVKMKRKLDITIDPASLNVFLPAKAM